MKKCLLALGVAVTAFSTLAHGTIWYVKQNATGTQSGSSWTNAFTHLQAALAASIPGDTIFVAAGTYKPNWPADGNSSNPRDQAFVIRNGAHFFGGFAGTEASLQDRLTDSLSLHVTNATVLSGDIGTVGDSTDNVFHVVIAANISNFTFDGFTITGGNADSLGTILINGKFVERRAGGGIYNIDISGTYGNLLVAHNTAKSNDDEFGGGGGVFNQTSSPTFSNCTFVSNHAESANGGAMKNLSSNAVISNCYFRNNSCNTDDEGGGAINNKTQSNAQLTQVVFEENKTNASGGAIYNDESAPELDGVLFIRNRAGNCGGGMDADNNSHAVLNNVDFVENHADADGGGLFGWRSSATLNNVRFSGNRADRNGGGMYNYTACNPILTNVTFIGNTAGDHYGGLGIERNSTAIVTNALFARNEAGGNGGGLGAHDNHGTQATIIATNITVVNNSASSGGGGYDHGTTTKLRNSIIIGNYPDDVDVSATLVIASRRNIIGDNGALGYIEDGSVNPIGVAVNWPVFIDTGASNYRLIAGSPAVDAGDSSFYNNGASPDLSAIVTDLRGAERTMGLQTDLGAFERCPISVTPSVTISVSPQQPVYYAGTQLVFAAHSVHGGINPQYQWYKNDVPIIGATDSIWKARAYDEITQEDTIWVLLTSADPCAEPEVAQSNKFNGDIRFDNVVSIRNDANQITSFPNPNNGSFAIGGLRNQTEYHTVITDLTGRKIYECHLQGYSTQPTVITMPPLNAGVYFLTVSGENHHPETIQFTLW